MLSVEAIRQLTAAIRYKPNYTLTIRGDLVPGELALRVVAMLPNVESDRQEIIPVVSIYPIPRSLFDRMDYLRFVETMLMKGEVHELNEWFKISGERYHNPHPERTHG